VKRAASGFTLIELLVTAVLLASVSAGVATVMSVCLAAWKAGQARADLSQQAGATLDILARDMRAAFIGRQGFLVSYDEGDGFYHLELTTASRRSLRLLYLAERGETPTENMSDLAQVVYFTLPAADGETFALYRQEICPPAAEPTVEEDLDPEQAQLLSDEVVAFRLRFWDAQQEADWLPEWDTTAESTTALPAAVEIVLALRDGDRNHVFVERVPVNMGENTQSTGQ
jgi:prepilin-type N-terminal cleavage/methylation domain-containing protein